MSKNLKPSWSFTVGDVSDIDIKKILDETPKESPYCIIADGEGNPRAIALRCAWCRKFIEADNLDVASIRLYKFWGRGMGHSVNQHGRRSFALELSSGQYDAWRLYPVEHQTLRGLLEEIEAAEKCLMRTTVRVYVKES